MPAEPSPARAVQAPRHSCELARRAALNPHDNQDTHDHHHEHNEEFNCLANFTEDHDPLHAYPPLARPSAGERRPPYLWVSSHLVSSSISWSEIWSVPKDGITVPGAIFCGSRIQVFRPSGVTGKVGFVSGIFDFEAIVERFGPTWPPLG